MFHFREAAFKAFVGVLSFVNCSVSMIAFSRRIVMGGLTPQRRVLEALYEGIDSWSLQQLGVASQLHRLGHLSFSAVRIVMYIKSYKKTCSSSSQGTTPTNAFPLVQFEYAGRSVRHHGIAQRVCIRAAARHHARTAGMGSGICRLASTVGQSWS